MRYSPLPPFLAVVLALVALVAIRRAWVARHRRD
jgi:hypothetical protein